MLFNNVIEWNFSEIKYFSIRDNRETGGNRKL